MKSNDSRGFAVLEAVGACCLGMVVIGALATVWKNQWHLIECERALFRRAHRERMASAEDEVRALTWCGGGRRELVLKSLELHRFQAE